MEREKCLRVIICCLAIIFIVGIFVFCSGCASFTPPESRESFSFLRTKSEIATVGEKGGLAYVYWNFDRDSFKTLVIDISIHSEPSNKDGLFFQLYQGKINGYGFYFGLQTDIYRPGIGSTGKGIIFSRWGTRDFANTKTAIHGWAQSAGYEGDFVGIRKSYKWTTHSYQFKLAHTKSDTIGDWYGVWILDKNTLVKDYIGSIRFEKTMWGSGIADGGVTWMELYRKESKNTPIPNWTVSVDKIVVIEEQKEEVGSYYAQSKFSKIKDTDIFYNEKEKRTYFLIGREKMMK